MSVAFVFPGQGSQSVGMLTELAYAFSIVRETFAEASEALELDLWALVKNGPEKELNLTHRTQPAMLAAGIAVWRVWRELGGLFPVLMAGHSFGEYAALVCAEALNFKDGIVVAAERGRLMQEAVPEGAGSMAAIFGLSDEQVERVCRSAAQGQVVSGANFNAPGQVVVAGATAAVERVLVLARQAGARRTLRLPVSVPVHCELMKPTAARLAEYLRGIEVHRPVVPVIQNADLASHDDPQLIRDALTRQLYQPVPWVKTIQLMVEHGVTCVFECGPGKVLTGLNKRIMNTLSARSISDSQTLADALTQAKGG
jgi:malonyl CoA-acyl carrier protein transacylase